ncbi:MAG: FIG00456380: hypothetical protein [uncultured Paraburkholderia sp.]|nr:MAG: FIG00456380: hypothetical protein [uncultured Paraburkholderia sp.]CAH2945902.1 MAG: FIG00456380: hypothetical protein [uncultured Paraburkholderia sp.]CAH2946026.1 MAG: FIG00456380: hypothetical protein [uncultured Paraburkholderia sp.]
MIIFAFREFVMENAVYWNGRQVGIQCDGRISWFSSVSPEAVAAYCGEPHNGAAQAVTTSDAVVARNSWQDRAAALPGRKRLP